MFEFERTSKGLITLSQEKQYRLVPPEEMTVEDLQNYRNRA